MANTKRTQREIENDCKKIKEAAKTAISMKDIEVATGLSYSMINTTLAKHPMISKRIKALLASNKLEAESTTLKGEKASSKLSSKTQNDDTLVTNSYSRFVIDASITGFTELNSLLSETILSKGKFILTSITIKELEQMQKFNNVDGHSARHILALAAENNENFINVLIDETLETPDDCIVKYCADNNSSVTLLTSDKTMALKARMYSVNVNYLKQPIHKTSANSKPPVSNSIYYKRRIQTLLAAKSIGDNLVISNFQTENRSIRVCSNGLEYNDGIRILNVGDDIFISTKKFDYITFAHYKIISLSSENNCELVYSKRIYKGSNVTLPKASYKSFIKDFKARHDL